VVQVAVEQDTLELLTEMVVLVLRIQAVAEVVLLAQMMMEMELVVQADQA
jgi:hypothetical protein